MLDRLLLIAPHGVLEIRDGDEVELRLRGSRAELPSHDAVVAAARDSGRGLYERALPDDWAARRLIDYRPRVIAGRLVVRPDWAPPAGGELLDLVLEEHTAFGAGSHPTTWTCLEQICELEPAGSFADLGCGSGVLAIGAALMGFGDVVAIDCEELALTAARANAQLNGVAIDVRSLDLAAEPPPPAGTIAANVPAAIHDAIAARLAPGTDTLIASGILTSAADQVAGRYSAAGLRETRRLDRGGWAVLVLRRAGETVPR